MRVGAIIRLVPDLGDSVDFTPDHTAIDLEWIDLRLNELDDQALEEAVLLAEGTPAEVVVLSLDVEGSDRALRTALARGATRAVKIVLDGDGDTPPDPHAAMAAYAEAARQINLDLLLVGVQSPEDLFGPLVGRLGAMLDWPFASAIAGTQIEAGAIRVQQEHGGGHTTELSMPLPAVLGIQTASKPTRYVSGSKLSETKSAPIETLKVSIPPGATEARVVSLDVRERSGGAEIVTGTPAEIAANIRGILSTHGVNPAQRANS